MVNTVTDTMNPLDSFPRCAGCGDRIGVYEPLWLEHADGSRVRAGLLTLGAVSAEHRLFHTGCLADENRDSS